jgi:O-antigen/teichoic acid export membrane protein
MSPDEARIDPDTRSIVKNAGIGVAGQGVFILLRFAVNIIITRTIGPDSYGIFVLAMTVIAFVEILAQFGLENTMVRYIAQYKAAEDRPRIRGTLLGGIGLVTLASIIFAVGVYASADILAVWIYHKPDLAPVLRILAIALPFSSLTVILMGALQGAKRIKFKVMVQRIQIPAVYLLLTAIAAAMGYHLNGIVWAYVAAAVVGTLIGGYYFVKTFGLIYRSGQKGSAVLDTGEMARFSVPLLLSGLFNRIISSSDILIMGYFLSAAKVGIYGVATRIPPLLVLPLNAVNTTFAPIIADLHAKQDRDQLERQFKTTTRHVVTVSIPLFTLVLCFPSQILSVFGPHFVEGAAALIFLMIGQMVNAATGSTGFMLMMTGRPWVNLFNSGMMCGLSIFLNLVLIPRYGILGAAWANAIAVSSVQILRVIEVWHFLRMYPYERDILKPIGSGLLSGGLLFVLPLFGWEAHHPVMILLVSFVYGVCYVAFLWLFGFSQGDQLIIRNVRRRLMKVASVVSPSLTGRGRKESAS